MQPVVGVIGLGAMGSGMAQSLCQMFMPASTAGFAQEDDSAVIKIFPGIELPKPEPKG